MIPALTGIALTTPASTIHLYLFGGITLHGFIWLVGFSLIHGRKKIAFFTGVLGATGLAILTILTVIHFSAPEIAMSLSPLGIFQKAMILLFGLFAIVGSIQAPNE